MTTYYVDGVDGADGNAGTSEGSGNAWATIQKAADTVAQGDKVWVKGNGDYVENVILTTPNTSPFDFVIEWEGYTTTTGDNGIATIAPTSGTVVSGSGESGQRWKNFRFTGGSSFGYADSAADYLFFLNCRFDNNANDGLTADNYCTAIKCQFDNNGGEGVDLDSEATFLGCVSFSNLGQGGFISNYGIAYKCISYGININDYGISFAAPGINDTHVLQCTIDGENNSGNIGVRGVTSSGDVVYTVDCIIYDCGTGISYEVANGGIMAYCGHNLLNSNTTDEVGVNYSENNVTGAPAFTDEANDDYTLGGSSPAIDAGMQPGLK